MKIVIFLIAIFSGNVFSQSDVTNIISPVIQKKIVAESTFNSTPYRQKEHQEIKDYFVSLSKLSEDALGSNKLNRRYNSYLRSVGIKKFCSDIFITKNDWEVMKANCTRNRFFLCSDDVLEYPTSKKSIGETLESDLKDEYSKATECQ
jgi:hypothetical protein